MRHITIPLFTLTFLLHLSAIAAALPERWDVDLAAQPPKVFELLRPRGESYEIEAVLNIHGKPFSPAITNACIYWQTNGMENLYWSAPATVSNNFLRASWLPSMDPGAATVRGYIGDPGHIYAAAFQFRFIASPGATPNELPLPQKVIDFARVTVLNPPWSGGGGPGGVDTNDVIDIVRKTVDGAAKMLPKHLWCMDFDDSYPDDAAWYYAQPQDYGSCSAVRDGGFLSRNYDWKFDDASEFVVRMNAGPGRFASVGVANCGTNLTEEIVTSGKPSRYFKCLPGRTVDGVNANGVCAEINVVGGDPDWHTEPTPTPVHPLAAVRWALDNATNAEHAAKFLASNIRFPQGWEQNFHYMVADELGTWIVENGMANGYGTSRAVMTNFIVDPPGEGEGYERYDLLFGGANITNAWYTRAYRRETNPPWVSDLKDVIDFTNEIFNAWASNHKEHFRNQTIGGQSWWQTCHTSIYDITNRTLRICVQEVDDWYTFAVPSAGGVKPEAVKAIVEPMIGDATNGIPEQIAALQDGKRDLTDEKCYNTTASWSSVCTPYSDRFSGVWWNEQEGVWYALFDGPEGSPLSRDPDAKHLEGDVDYDGVTHHIVADLTNVDQSHVLARRSATAANALAKLDTDGNLTADTNATAEVAKVKDKADEFTAWVYDKPNVEIEYLQNLGWHPKVGGVFNGDENSLELHWSSDQSYYNIDFTATRKRVLRTGEAATPQDLQDAMSPTNPTFSNAVVTVASELTPPALPYMRQYDSVLHCWWIGRMVNGVIEWEVE